MAVPIHVIMAGAQQHAAREKLLAQLREAGANSAPLAASLDVEGDEGQSALDELLKAGTVHEARRGLYFIDESRKAEQHAGLGFKLLLVLLVAISIVASAATMLAAAG